MKYPLPSGVHVADFVTVKPCVEGDERMNFKIWKEQMLGLLESQDVIDFVSDGMVPPSDKYSKGLYEQWRRTDRLVRGWILGSIGKDALDAVWEKQTAREVWLELGKIFNDEEKEKDVKDSDDESRDMYNLLMYRAAWEGEWDTAQNLLKHYEMEAAATISSRKETALHVAILINKRANIEFVKKMVKQMPPEALTLKDSDGDTALHNAALVGNTKAAECLVRKYPDLLNIFNEELSCYKELPVMTAATNRQEETLDYLISISNFNDDNSPFKGQSGAILLNTVIASELFDVALSLVDKYPYLARLEVDGGGFYALPTLAGMASVFHSGQRFSFSWWQTFIYCVVPPKQSKHKAAQAMFVVGDIENRRCDAPTSNNYSRWFHNFKGGNAQEDGMHNMGCHGTFRVVPGVKEMRKKKAKHEKAVQLVKKLCKEMSISLPEKKASPMFVDSILTAAENGISEIVEEILKTYPMVAFASDPHTRKDVFLLAATNRHENVFNLIHNVTAGKFQFHDEDSLGNNLLDVCGKLPPSDRLNVVPGAALQMQRELQWFKEMEKLVHPLDKGRKNEHGQTSQMLFTKEHRHLKKEGETWMKDTATACNIAAALIATIMFSAAFTKPGGDDGKMLADNNFALDLFAISDVISLFTSITSLLMFLSILTSRYAEQDFLHVLPKRLTLGLISLFVSITFMLVAFSATMYIEFHDRLPWVRIPMAAFACLPIATFVLLQFPLLVDVVYLTYGPGIFRRNKNWCISHIFN